MKQEDKDLLLKDLCARLPYGVKFEYENRPKVCEILSITPIYDSENVVYFDDYINYPKKCSIYDVKPYLFPLSSMTDTQREEYESLCIKETSECIDISGFSYTKDNYYDTVESIDYLYKNHIDIRGLIEKGLALDATGLNIY